MTNDSKHTMGQTHPAVAAEILRALKEGAAYTTPAVITEALEAAREAVANANHSERRIRAAVTRNATDSERRIKFQLLSTPPETKEIA